MNKKIGGQLGPLPRSFFPKGTRPKCWDSHFVQLSRKTWGRLYPPQSPGEGLQIMNYACCLHLALVIGKYTDVFRGNSFWWGETLKLKTNKNYSVYERGYPLLKAPLFTLKFDSFSKLYFLKQQTNFSLKSRAVEMGTAPFISRMISVCFKF